MTNNTTKRPFWVWAISILLGLSAISQFLSHTLILSFSELGNPQVKSVVDSWGAIDLFSPYVLSISLLISMIQLFRLKESSYKIFTFYFVLVFSMTIYQGIAASWLTEFQLQGVLSALGGILIMLIVFFYIRRLKLNNVLIGKSTS